MHAKTLGLPENNNDSVDRWLAQSPGLQIFINILLTAEKFNKTDFATSQYTSKRHTESTHA